MGEHGPVTDWATDFDHTDEVWAADPYPILEELREQCPVAHSGRYGGVWLPVNHDDVSAIANDTEHFSSRSIIVSEFQAAKFMAPIGIAPPISSDPPYHHDARRMLLPIFSPQKIDELEPSTRAYCHELLDAVAGKDIVDAAEDYAQHIPVRVIATMLGLPEDDADLFRGFVHHVLEGVAQPIEARGEGMIPLFGYLRDQIADHIENPRDDLISFLLEAELDGQKLDPFQVGRTIGLLLIAGIDTTWSAIGASLWHLAKTPADRERLVKEPDLLPTAMEEFLRAYA
ncbi:MAG TPA: cytochrome P450, partial [Acidimicrobiales bacterium]|nr:cytochrome P450 [Acidimicrobiales bacterium]